jgi:hypothetical protein
MAIHHPSILPRTSFGTLKVLGPASERYQSYDCNIQIRNMSILKGSDDGV